MLGYCLRSYESVSAALFCREKLHAYDLRCRLVCPCAVHAAEKGLPDCGYTDPWAAEICVFFAAAMFVQALFTGIAYQRSSLLYSYFLSVFVYFIGFFAAGRIHEEKRDALANAYVISAFVVSLIIYIQYFAGNLSALSGAQYLYSSKNSISQIAVTAIVLLLIVIRPKTRPGRIIRFLLLAFEVVFMFLLRSRATIVEFFVVILMLLFSNVKARHLNRSKCMILGAAAALLLLLCVSNRFYRFLSTEFCLPGAMLPRWTASPPEEFPLS